MFATHNQYIKLLAQQGLFFLQYIIFTLKEVKKGFKGLKVKEKLESKVKRKGVKRNKIILYNI